MILSFPNLYEGSLFVVIRVTREKIFEYRRLAFVGASVHGRDLFY